MPEVSLPNILISSEDHSSYSHSIPRTRPSSAGSTSSHGSDLGSSFHAIFSLISSGDDPVVDIVAIENLSPSLFGSWRDPEIPYASMWFGSNQFLPEVLPKARLFNFAYFPKGRFDIRRIAISLLSNLKASRESLVHPRGD